MTRNAAVRYVCFVQVPRELPRYLMYLPTYVGKGILEGYNKLAGSPKWGAAAQRYLLFRKLERVQDVPGWVVGYVPTILYLPTVGKVDRGCNL